MALFSLFVFFVLSNLVLLHSAEEGKKDFQKCQPFHCGKFGSIHFPFANSTNPECGLCRVDCDERKPTIQLGFEWDKRPRTYEVINISQPNSTSLSNTIRIKDQALEEKLSTRKCEALTNLTFPNNMFVSFKLITPNLTIFKCNHNLNITSPIFLKNMSCNDNNFYYSHSNNSSPSFNSECSIIQLPVKGLLDYDNLFTFLTAEFDLEVHVSDPCLSCHRRGGRCFNHGEFYCTIAEKENKKNKVVIVIAVGCAVIIFMIFVSFVIRHHYKKKYASSNLIAKNTYPDPSSRSEVDGGSVYFGVPVFSYSELLEATKNFDIEKELGDGGFGTVYHGKLSDGREVAVKRLYEHNYRRVQQFMNEVKILTCLHHKNLVSLYGCTSCHSRELLLVYEYVPNGTVADHIHGNRATSDFGLSRLFPNDVTHVSTAPQGTPGYVDPEYHQCYQLTSKSDVYSFGVVLVELISSLLAVDIARQRHEINLANLAINKIQMCAFHELIDPHLGFESDNEVNRMTISVAELAFLCIQQDKEMRPSMDEVLEALKKIQSGEDAPEDRENAYDVAGILNVQLPAAPNAVTDNWTSNSTTPNVSGLISSSCG